MKLAERRRIQKPIAIHWYRGKWQAAVLVSTLNATKNVFGHTSNGKIA